MLNKKLQKIVKEDLKPSSSQLNYSQETIWMFQCSQELMINLTVLSTSAMFHHSQILLLPFRTILSVSNYSKELAFGTHALMPLDKTSIPSSRQCTRLTEMFMLNQFKPWSIKLMFKLEMDILLMLKQDFGKPKDMLEDALIWPIPWKCISKDKSILELHLWLTMYSKSFISQLSFPTLSLEIQSWRSSIIISHNLKDYYLNK